MKLNRYIEFSGVQVNVEELEKKFKEFWKSQNKKIKEIQSLNMYYNVEEQKCYFVVNETDTYAI